MSGKGQKERMRDYYDALRTERWQGTGRFQGAQSGRQIHLRKTALLSAVYLTKQFRTTEPRLLTTGRYAVAPVLNTTKIGKVLNTGLNVLRAGKTFGVGIQNNTYPDLPLDNPLKRVTNIFSGPSDSKSILKKYGLTPKGVTEHGEMYESDGDGSLSYKQNEFEDLIPVKFRHTDNEGNKIVTQVRGAIAALSDTIAPTWNDVTYVGRPDAFKSYGGFARDVSFDLTLAAMNEMQLYPMWQKINRLAQYVLPQVDPGAPVTRYAGKLVEVKVGNYLDFELCAMTGFTITPNEEANWEIGDPYIDHPSLTLAEPFIDSGKALSKSLIDKIKLKKNTLGAKGEGDDGSPTGKLKTPMDRKSRKKATRTPYIMPRVVTINIGLSILHNHVPGDPKTMTPLFKLPNTNSGEAGASENPLTD